MLRSQICSHLILQGTFRIRLGFLCACFARPRCQPPEWSKFERTILGEVHCESNPTVLHPLPLLALGAILTSVVLTSVHLATWGVHRDRFPRPPELRVCGSVVGFKNVPVTSTPPGDPNAGDLECSLGNPSLKIRSSPSGSHELP